MSDPVTTVQKQWAIGDVRVTIVVESQTDHIPPELFFTDASAEAVARHEWLVPDFADDEGRIGLSVQAFVVETPTRTVVVDPCVGNGKTLEMPFWNEQQWPFWERFEAAGFSADDVDLVVHTHLHADHVGWDTRLVDETWVPTFAASAPPLHRSGARVAARSGRLRQHQRARAVGAADPRRRTR